MGPVILCFLIITISTCASDGAQNSRRAKIIVTFGGMDSNTTLYKKYVHLQEHNNDTVMNITGHQNFYTFQVHSFIDPVNLTSDEQEISGNNIGLLQKANYSAGGNEFWLEGNGTVLIVVQLDSVFDLVEPVPGHNSSTINVNYTSDVVTVTADPASECEECTYEIFYCYLPASDLTSSGYFNGIEKMLSVEQIRSNGFKIPEIASKDSVSGYHSNYAGHGIVYAIVMNRHYVNSDAVNRSAAYVSTVSYGCDISQGMESCYGSWKGNLMILRIIILVAGIAIAFTGKKNNMISAFFNLTFLIIELCNMAISLLFLRRLDSAIFISLYISLPIASILSLLLMNVLQRYKIAIVFNNVIAGYTFATFVFSFSLVGQCSIFQSDLMYWCIFLSVIMIVFCFLPAFVGGANIIMSNAYLTLGINYFWGGSLNYIILNNLRRASVDNFNVTAARIPWQAQDVLSLFAGIVITYIGIKFQRKFDRRPGREEYTPLLQ